MDKIFTMYLQVSLWGSVIILMTLLLRVLLHKAPRRILCVLWLLAAVRLLFPFQLESRLSLQPRYGLWERNGFYISQTDRPAETVHDTDVQIGEGAAQITPEPIQEKVDYLQIASTVWASVAGTALFYTLFSYMYMKFKVRDAVRCDGAVMESERIYGAFVLGYFGPRVYLPRDLAENDRQFIIAHERAHIARGDNWWKLLGFICVCLHWFNPLVWLGYILMCRDIEMACDEQVIYSMEVEERKAYSTALLNCGKRSSGLSACPVAFGEVSLKTRIKNVLFYRKPAFSACVVAIMLVALVALCFLTVPEAAGATEPVLFTEQEQGTQIGEMIQDTTVEVTEETTETTEATEATEAIEATEGAEATQPTLPSTPVQTVRPVQPAAPAVPDSQNGNSFDIDVLDADLTAYAAKLGFQTLDSHGNTKVKCFSFSSMTSSLWPRNVKDALYKEGKELVDAAYDYCREKGSAAADSVVWVRASFDSLCDIYCIWVYCATVS